MTNPITLEELKEHIRELLPEVDIDVDEETDEVIIFTNHREGISGELEELDDDELISGLDSEMIELIEPLEDEGEEENN